MSFLLDPPALIVIGAALYFVGKELKLERLTKITIGLLVVLIFILFSLMLYADIFRCIFPVLCNCNCASGKCLDCIDGSMSGSMFMFHSNIWPYIKKDNVPFLFVLILFLLYPVWIYFGYAFALLSSKRRRRVQKDFKTYKDVKSRRKIPSHTQFSIVRYPDIGHETRGLEDAVRKAVKDAGGIEIAPGNKVLIKANICGGVPDNPATYTSMDLVEYVVRIVRDAGGEPIICDADMIWTKFWENARAIGWVDRIQDINKQKGYEYVKLLNLSETGLAYFDFGEGSVFEDNDLRNKEIVSKELIDADVIISIPKMKTHLLTGVTLGMKNMYGTLPEIDKAEYHRKGINEVIYWINYAFHPNLTIIDGSIGGEAIGPLSAESVQFNTIVASNNVVIADAIASKLIGYDDPFEEIDHLKLAKDLSNLRDKSRLLTDIPDELNYSAAELIRNRQLPENSKDGKWDRPDSEIAEKYENLMENLLMLPFMETLFNIGADFFLFDAARIPILKYFNTAILQVLYEAPLFWTERGRKTFRDVRRGQFNLVVFILLTAASLIFFYVKGYWSLFFGSVSTPNGTLIQSSTEHSLWFVIIFASAIVLGALLARRMRTKYLLAITLASLLVAHLVESYGPLAQWWTYGLELPAKYNFTFPGIGQIQAAPLFPLFVIPIPIIVIIGLAHYLKGAFAYVGLKGETLRLALAPYLFIMLALVAFLYLEIFHNKLTLTGDNNPIIIIYIIFALLGLYFNAKQPLEWNLALVTLAVPIGFLMELSGALCGFWGYPPYPQKFEPLPIFLSFHWALNTWAVGGLALLFGINISEAFPESAKVSDPRFWINKADELITMGRHQKALDAYERAIEIDPQLADAWCGKGSAFAGLGRPLRALKAYEKALEIDPQYVEAWKLEADIFMDLSQPKKAIKAYEEAIKLNPKDPDLWVDKALAFQHHQVGDFRRSIETYNQAMESIRDRSSRKLLNFMGFAYADLADMEGAGRWYKEAIECFDKIINASPMDSFDEWLVNAWWGKGYVLASLRMYEESLDAFCKLELYPKASAFVWCDMGDVLYDQGKHEHALEAYNRAINLSPEFACELQMAKAWEGKGDALSKLNNKLEALKAYMRSLQLFDEAIERDSKDTEAWLGKGYALYKREMHQEALEAYNRAIELAKSSPPITTPSESSAKLSLAKALTRKSIVLCRMGDRQKAIEAVEDALNAAPDYLPALRAREQIIGEPNHDKAGGTVDANPRYAEALQRRGASLRMLDRSMLRKQ